MLPFGIPLGNLLTVAGLVSLALAAVQLSQGWLRRVAWLAVWLSVAWYPACILLAGNTALNFSGQRGVMFLWLTAITVLLVLLSFAAAVTTAVYRTIRRRWL